MDAALFMRPKLRSLLSRPFVTADKKAEGLKLRLTIRPRGLAPVLRGKRPHLIRPILQR
jgi:hypothetical protein